MYAFYTQKYLTDEVKKNTYAMYRLFLIHTHSLSLPLSLITRARVCNEKYISLMLI